MSKFKDILSIAFEMGMMGHSWNSVRSYLQDSSYGKVIEPEDYATNGSIYKNYLEGVAEKENRW